MTRVMTGSGFPMPPRAPSIATRPRGWEASSHNDGVSIKPGTVHSVEANQDPYRYRGAEHCEHNEA